VENLEVQFVTRRRALTAIAGVSLEIAQGEVLGVVGESGCGKSLTALSTIGLLPYPGRVTNGKVLFEGRDLLSMNDKALSSIRGRNLSMIFQDPMLSLDPVYRCGDQIAAPMIHHKKISRKEAFMKGAELLELVGISHPERVLNAYPHQLSGGMCQRVMIAIALSCGPKLLIADEPTTALDVTVQAQILELMGELRKELGMGVMLITHDLGVIAGTADRVAVMYAGEIVETGSVQSLFENPMHPYTRGLLKSIPRLNQGPEKLYNIPGVVPTLDEMPDGCRFHPRCENSVSGRCAAGHPSLVQAEDGHWVRCHRNGEA